MSDLGYLDYQTLEGDRWDLIAYRMYGDALAFEPIIAANPQVAILPVLPGGLTLYIPIRAPQTAKPADLPPWKR